MLKNIQKLIRKEILNFVRYIPGKPIEELKKEFKINKIYKLASNENALGVSKHVIESIKKNAHLVNIYPESSCIDLRLKLAKTLKLQPDNFLIGSGSDEIIELLGKTFLNKSDNIIVSRHAFIRYKMAGDLMGANVKVIPMTKNLVHDTKAMLNSITNKTKVIFIANPNNPTGTYIKNSDFQSFIKKVPKNILVVMDEAYYEYITEKDYPQTVSYLKKYNNLIVLRTFSKLYSLAGLRIGYMIADKSITSFIDRIRPPFNVNIIAQRVCIKALDDKKHVLKSKLLVRDGKKYLYSMFKKLNIEYIPSAANFILFKVPGSGKDVFKKLLRLGIIVRAMDEYELKNYVRITIGNKNENEAFIKAFKKVL